MATDFHLICQGIGTANAIDAMTTNARDSDGNSASATTYANRSSGFHDEVAVEIVEGVGRIRLPRSLLPPIHGGSEGWFQLKNLKQGDNDITASAAVSFISAPKVRISRLTGAIAIDGHTGSFAGHCEPFDPATQKRAF